MRITATIVAALLVSPGWPALADESTFLRTLDGDWIGEGSVRLRTHRDPISVSCDFTSTGEGSELSVDGRCRALSVFSRNISANLAAQGSSYSGVYVGAGTGQAGLKGTRNGQAINLTVTWARTVNGDREARMTLEKLNQNAMRLTTVDRDPETGRNVTTSTITLQRK